MENLSDYVTIPQAQGVACWVAGTCLDQCLACGGSHNWEDEDGIWECQEHHEDCMIVVMVGNDRRHHVDASDIKPLRRDQFCGGCGQIGCAHG